MSIKNILTIKAINRLKENRNKLTESERRFIDKFEVIEETFVFTDFGVKRCGCEELCEHRNGLRFFPIRKLELDQKIQNKLFIMSSRFSGANYTN